MTWSLSAEPTSPSLLLALNPEPKATPGAEPSEVAVTPSLPTTGTPSAIYLPFPQVLRFRTGGTLMAQPTPTTDEGPIIIHLVLLVLQQHLETSVEGQGARGQAVLRK